MSIIDKHSLGEKERIKSLKKYDILDTPPDGSFDRITKLAAKLLDVPIALVTLVDTDRIWFKSRYGLDVQQIGRDPGLCASAILSDDLYEVKDALTDPRTLVNPLVAGEFGLRFYAAVPLKVRDGHNLGTLCVLDKKPRNLTEIQKETLQYLADILIDQLELRLAARTANYQQNQVLSIAAHDLKNPLTTLKVWAELARQAKDKPDQVENICDKITESCGKMNRLINNLLETARKEASKIQLRFAGIDLGAMTKRVVASNMVLAINKNLKLNFINQENLVISADEERLTEILNNIISNAIKYSPKNKNINVSVNEKDGQAVFIVADEGQGFTEDDKKNLYQRFVKLSALPTGGESSTGLGLSIVKFLVDAHHGTIEVSSDGKDKGAIFTVKFPLLK
ncbi:MAG: GAF domain-containing sensor histidine kinase [Chitinophagaceae bacterium]|nr:GAF domain-containing sensor histidine kinase [Chitinophagaceae bacterium]